MSNLNVYNQGIGFARPNDLHLCDDPEEILNLYGEYNIKQILPELKKKYL